MILGVLNSSLTIVPAKLTGLLANVLKGIKQLRLCLMLCSLFEYYANPKDINSKYPFINYKLTEMK
jgi:hypothetical protein